MKKNKLFSVCLLLLYSTVYAEETVYIWPDKTGPGSENVAITQQTIERSKISGYTNRAITGVTQPYYTVYRPETPNGRAVLICPGGAYQRVVIDVEGAEIAAGYTAAGYTAFVLVYRLPGDGHKNSEVVPLEDAQRAIRLIRSKASEYGISPYRVGVLGFSAGGHLAASLGTRYSEQVYKKIDTVDEQSAKPDFLMLVYPVITMSDPFTHTGSRKALLGDNPTPEETKSASCEKMVSPDTPITFIVCAQDDHSVNPTGNAIAFWQACTAQNVKAELHIFPESGHGFGISNATGTAKQWQTNSITWLNTYLK
jgi:acetyl esterase/lipase